MLSIFTNKMEVKIKLRWIHIMCMYTQINSIYTLRNLFEHLIYKNVIKNILKYNTILLISSKEFEDTKRVIRICKLMKDRKHNGKAKKGKRTNNDLQNKTHKTKD
jgi:hypothetical protein